jgi:serine acetyltransferase
MLITHFKRWAKARQSPLADFIYRIFIFARHFSMPVIPLVHSALYHVHVGVRTLWDNFTRIFWYTPLFQTRLIKPAKDLNLWGGMPVVIGNIRISIGDGCIISGHSTISGRPSSSEIPMLVIGNNVGIGWNVNIAVGKKIVIGNNVRISGGSFISGYPGHPIDAADRAANKPDTEDQIGDIIIEDDVWLASNVTVSAGVTIGQGTIVAAHSVVTKDLPAFVLAAGAPAVVKRSLLPKADIK